jgi:hypothetical protein
MVSIVQKQNSFIGGLLTEERHGRTDKPMYYHTLRRANNIVIGGQGGFRRRQGTSLVGEIAHLLDAISVGCTRGIFLTISRPRHPSEPGMRMCHSR